MAGPSFVPHSCCMTGSVWSSGQPTGRAGTLASNQAYIAGTNPTRAVLLIHDLLGWTFPNTRLLADAYAREAECTVYLPDFFGGKTLPFEPILAGRWDELDVSGFMRPNGRDAREGEILACARALKDDEGFEKVGAVGFCYGGWAVFRLGAREFNGGEKKLVDCISAGHPTFLTEADIDAVGVPFQVLAPEHDPVYSVELKKRTFEVGLTAGVPFDYQHFPGVQHACFTRGDERVPGERDALVRGKDAAVAWFKRFLEVE
ncbi:dienelactone hydrolase family protein [Macrophomina phaseolina]|uniref:Dienelactone hydrolase family protein n=1 Tax=Macrophomina phaseolina TaxID=35725 RepID=A0ABQ8GQZ3_9PEZI|nr:dienelactone hydrolase family protein [Macrophomina phaseolina]